MSQQSDLPPGYSNLMQEQPQYRGYHTTPLPPDHYHEAMAQQYGSQNGAYAGAYPGAYAGAYPGAYAGAYPGAYAGAYPGAYAGQDEDDDFDGVDEWLNDEEFARNLQFGLIDNGLLVAMALAGISLEDYIADKVGVQGYGVLLGATVGNALSDGVAALPQGYKAAGGVTLGALIPVIPLGVAIAMKKPPTGMTKNVLLGSSAALLAFAFLSKKLKKQAGEKA